MSRPTRHCSGRTPQSLRSLGCSPLNARSAGSEAAEGLGDDGDGGSDGNSISRATTTGWR